MKPSTQAWILGLLAAGCLLALLFGPAACKADLSRPISQRVADEVAVFAASAVTGPHDSLSVEVEAPRVPVPGTEVVDIRCDLYGPGPVAGSVPVRVTLTLRDGSTRVVTVSAKVRLFDTVVVAARKLDRLEVLSPSDFRIERREITGLADAYFKTTDDLTAVRTTAVLLAGSVIERGDVESIPLVKRGAGVLVAVVVGGVTVTSKARALEDGDLGDTIKVQDVITKKRLAATVRGGTLVVLDGSSL
jgi:flagella basal body P-ring formation protein FlgA